MRLDLDYGRNQGMFLKFASSVNRMILLVSLHQLFCL